VLSLPGGAGVLGGRRWACGQLSPAAGPSPAFRPALSDSRLASGAQSRPARHSTLSPKRGGARRSLHGGACRQFHRGSQQTPGSAGTCDAAASVEVASGSPSGPKRTKREGHAVDGPGIIESDLSSGDGSRLISSRRFTTLRSRLPRSKPPAAGITRMRYPHFEPWPKKRLGVLPPAASPESRAGSVSAHRRVCKPKFNRGWV